MSKINKNKKYIIWGFILIFLFSLIYLLFLNKKEISLIVPEDKNYSTEKIESKPEIKLRLEKSKEPLKKEESINLIKASIVVNNDRYDSSIKEGSTAFDLMEKINNDNLNYKFDFAYTKNPSLGNFITEINGIKGSPGKYWIYYVNEKKPSVGVSNYVLKDGDIIRWSGEGM